MKRPRLFALLLAAALVVPIVWAAQASPARSVIDHHSVKTGQIVTVAGGAAILPGTEPRKVSLLAMSGVTVHPRSGDVYVSDAHRHMIFRVPTDASGIFPVAGIGIGGFNGDGRPALETLLHVPGDLVVHPKSGDIYFADTHNYRVRVISADGRSVRTVAGKGIAGVAPEDIPTEFPLVGPHGRRTEAIFSGDGGPAIEAELNQPMSVALDGAGNLYIADTGNHRIRLVNMGTEPLQFGALTIAPGAIQTIAGSGEIGFAGDGSSALVAEMDTPRRVRVTPEGDVLFIDMLNNRLRRIDRSTGRVTTESVGTAIQEDQSWSEVQSVDWSLDGLALSGVDANNSYSVVWSDHKLNSVFATDVAVGSTIAAASPPVNQMRPERETSPEQWLKFRSRIRTPRRIVAGTGAQGRAEDGTAADRAPMFGAGSVAVGLRGEVYVVDSFNQILWKVEDGVMTVFAGSGSPGEAILATRATVGTLASIAVDANGDVYFPDMFLHKIRRISAADGKVYTYAGRRIGGYSGDGGPPDQAQLLSPLMLTFDGRDMFISDPAIPVIRRIVRSNGAERIETIAGIPFSAGGFEIIDGIPARAAQLGMPQEVVRHPITGELYLSDSLLNVIRKIDRNGIISTVAGIGPPWNQGYGGDRGPALEAQFNWPSAMLFDAEGNLYVTDVFNHRIRRLGADGTVTTFAGSGEKGFGGDGGPAQQAKLNNPVGLDFDVNGDMYIADSGNHRIRKIEMRPPYTITTVVGNGKRGFAGDRGPAIAAELNQPRGVAFGPDNTLYITDSLNARIRAVRIPVREMGAAPLAAGGR